MSTTYAQKQSPAQKKDAPTAASVLDSSSQSESLQRKADMANNATQRAEAPRPNNTGMPDNLKAGIESLSGFSMDDVRVHYNSSKPATVQALAYTQGTDIHVAPGQEKHLPHEAWHVAQQMAGRVSPTTNINGMPVNDNAALEHEADVMGEKAVTQRKTAPYIKRHFPLKTKVAQRMLIHGTDYSTFGELTNYIRSLPQGNLDYYEEMFLDLLNKHAGYGSVDISRCFTYQGVAEEIAKNNVRPADLLDNTIRSMFTGNNGSIAIAQQPNTPNAYYSNANVNGEDVYNILYNSEENAKRAAIEYASTYIPQPTPGHPNSVSPFFFRFGDKHLTIKIVDSPTGVYGVGIVFHAPDGTFLQYGNQTRMPAHYHAIRQPLTRHQGPGSHPSPYYTLNGDFVHCGPGLHGHNHFLINPF